MTEQQLDDAFEGLAGLPAGIQAELHRLAQTPDVSDAEVKRLKTMIETWRRDNPQGVPFVPHHPQRQAVVEGRIEDLVFDPHNANRHTPRGMGALEKSIQRLGLGRSVLVDRNNRVIAGNATAQKAGEVGAADRVVFVDVDGSTLVAVRRTDVDIDSAVGKELAVADNRVGELNLDWDAVVLDNVRDDIDLSAYFTDAEMATLTAAPEDVDMEDPTLSDREELRVQYPNGMGDRIRGIIAAAIGAAGLTGVVSYD